MGNARRVTTHVSVEIARRELTGPVPRFVPSEELSHVEVVELRPPVHDDKSSSLVRADAPLSVSLRDMSANSANSVRTDCPQKA